MYFLTSNTNYKYNLGNLMLYKQQTASGNLFHHCTPMSNQGALILAQQLRELRRTPVDGFSVGLMDENDLFEWKVVLMGPPDTPYEGGVFHALLRFPSDYPNSPPKFRFTSPFFHPNVYADGSVCISILHPGGDDPNAYERPEERWLPIHTVSSILLSVIAMLNEPNCNSPANPEASRVYRNDRRAYMRRVAETVRASQSAN